MLHTNVGSHRTNITSQAAIDLNLACDLAEMETFVLGMKNLRKKLVQFSSCQ